MCSETKNQKINTRISRLFDIRYPVIQGGMIWVSGWKLATAVSMSGGLGLIGAGSMSPALLAEHLKKASAVWNGPIGVNVPLMRDDADKLIDVIVKSNIKIVFTSAGNPAKFTDHLHNHNIIVVHVVPSLKLALKAAQRGVDAIVGEGTEAGGHNGFEEISTFNLIPRLADHIDLPIIAAGGIRDGRGMAAALALGAAGVQIGTRFACTVESSASEAYKQAVTRSGEPATLLTLKKISPTRMMQGNFAARIIEAESRGASRDELSQLLDRGRARKGIFFGDLEEGYMEAGEVAGDIRAIETVEKVMDQIIESYFKTVRTFEELNGHLPLQ